MKILILCGDLTLIGGIEKYNKDLIKSLKQLKFSIKVIERLQGSFLQKIIFSLKTIYFFITYKPDYIICCHLNFSPILIFLNFLKKIKYSVSIYGIDAISNFSFMKALALKKADKILTISNYTKNLILDQIPKYKKNIFIIKSCVNENLYKNINTKMLKKKYNIGNKKIIMTLSRMSFNEEKGHNRVLESLELVEKKYSNFLYMIVGGGHDERIDKILRNNKTLSERVIFTGPIKDSEKYNYLSLADLFILPSKNEGFAIVFLEALISGLTVIAPNKYGCPEGLLNGELGILVNVDRKDLIAKAILSVFCEKIPNKLKNKKLIISKTKKIYGLKRWNNDIKKFMNSIKI